MTGIRRLSAQPGNVIPNEALCDAPCGGRTPITFLRKTGQPQAIFCLVRENDLCGSQFVGQPDKLGPVRLRRGIAFVSVCDYSQEAPWSRLNSGFDGYRNLAIISMCPRREHG